MQRKNNILKSSRSGIAMIMAITVIVIISTIMALSLAMTAQTTKRTADLYLYEQSVLLSKSAAEYALLRIAQDGPCENPNGFHFTQDTIYDINITMQYVYTEAATCNNADGGNGGNSYFIISTDEQNGSVLMDITVSVNDTSIVSEPIRYFRRTIQKL